MELGIVLDYLFLVSLGLVAGFWLHVHLSRRKINELNELELDLGPWRDKVRRLGMETQSYDIIIDKFSKYDHFSGTVSVANLVERINFTINDSYKLRSRGWTETTTMRNLYMSTTPDDWDNWRRCSLEVVNKPELYITAGILEEFIFQTTRSSLTLEQKTKLSHDIREQIYKYPNNIKDILNVIRVALDYDDLLYEYDWNSHGSYVNYDCIMWGCKKVMENIHKTTPQDVSNMFDKLKRIPGKSKTRKCSSYKQRKRNKKEKSNE